MSLVNGRAPSAVWSMLAHVPGAAGQIVHDPFHLVKHMNEVVNAVRVREHKRLLAAGDDTLKNTRQLWLYGIENVPSQHAQRFDELKELNLQTSRAWAIKEVFRSFWLCDTVKKAERYFDPWHGWAIRSRLAPVKKVARMCKSHLGNLLTYFVHRLTNGPIDGLNNVIRGLIKKAFGYRNKDRFKTDIFFHFEPLPLRLREAEVVMGVMTRDDAARDGLQLRVLRHHLDDQQRVNLLQQDAVFLEQEVEEPVHVVAPNVSLREITIYQGTSKSSPSFSRRAAGAPIWRGPQ